MKFALVILASLHICLAGDILMITMGGTKSHKIPFWELARGLIPRGHNITFLNGFPADFSLNGLQEITPGGLVEFIQNFTNWDLLGARMRGEMPIAVWDVVRYPYEACKAMMEDSETHELMNRKFDLLILDGAYPECALGLVHKYGVPFMYINTVGFYVLTLSVAGSPAPYSMTPLFTQAFTDNMNFMERFVNAILNSFVKMLSIVTGMIIHTVLTKHIGEDMPPIYELAKNVSFILQNGQASVSYPRPYLPNVAEIACIHCKPAGPLPKDLEDFVSGAGESGFIYVSMGSSVKAANMPENLRQLLVQTFAQLPYRVLWKWEGGLSGMQDLPSNVKLGRWLPQQDILGHRKLRAFITHGGLLSMFETVYHGVPIVTLPVFCDHDSNSAKAEIDGYAFKLLLETLTTEKLVRAITKVIHDPKYRIAARKRQILLKDQRTTPLETAVYWTEYVLRHNGAYHLQSPSRNLSAIQYYCLDVLAVIIMAIISLIILIRKFIIRPEFFLHSKKEKVH